MSGKEVELTEIARYDKLPCASCGSVDNLSVYEKEDEEGVKHYDGICWGVCSADGEGFKSYKWLQDNGIIDELGAERMNVVKKNDTDHTSILEEIAGYESRGVRERKIKKKYAEMYGLKVSYDQESGEIDTHYYPVTKEDGITGYFKRTLPKQFSAIGDVKDTQLQGQHLFDKGGEYENIAGKKFIIITEGFLDMVAVQQMMSESRPDFVTAVVSLPNGINTKAIKTNYKFLNSFESVIICADQDDAGGKGAKEICKCLPMGKTKIMSYSKKDPCEMLKAGLSKEFYRSFWQASSYSPAGIVDGQGLWGTLTNKEVDNAISYPWEGLNKLLGGIRLGEMVTLTAGSGIAKSSIARAILHHIVKTTDSNVGGMFLEESIKRTGLSIMSYEAKKLLHLPDAEYTEEEFKAAFDATLGTGRVFLYDHFGSMDIDTIIENISYFARAANCKYIFLDHISIMVSGGDQGDERKALDEICTKLRTAVQELNISLIIISHLKRPSGDLGHEQGAQTSLAQLRGSAAIAQLSDGVIGIERNQQHDDPLERNTSTLRVLKNRFAGTTGVAARVLYNNLTGEIVERSDIDETADNIEEFFADEPVFEQEVDMTDF